MTLEQAMSQSTSLWSADEYKAKKALYDKRFLAMGHTEESRSILLDYISGKTEKINLDDIARMNAPAHLNDRVSHGFTAFGNGGWGVNDNSGMSEMDVINRNIDTVMSNKNIELAMSGDTHRLGDIGVVGKAEITGYFPRDISSKVKNGVRTSGLRGSVIVNDIMDEGLGQTYSEYFGKNFQVDALWVRDSFLQEHQDEVVSMIQKHGIENVEIVRGSAMYSPHYTPKATDIERIKASDLYERVKQSSVVNPTEPIHINPSIDEQYQRIIDERLFGYKDRMVSLLSQNNMLDEAQRVQGLNLEDFTSELRRDIDASLEKLIPESQKELMRQLGESTTYSGIYFGENIGKGAGDMIEMLRYMPVSQDAMLLRKNDSLILFAHGSADGRIMFHDKLYSPEKIVQEFYDKGLIPDDIKNLYTLNCYGGKQQSFIGPNGINVKSAHTSTTPILATAMGVGADSPMFNVSLNTGDMIDEVKQLSMQSGTLDVLHTPKEINQAFLQSELEEEKRLKAEKSSKRIDAEQVEQINETLPEDMPKVQTQEEVVESATKDKSNMKIKQVSEAGQEAIEKGAKNVAKDTGQEAIENVAKNIPTAGAGKYVALAIGALAVGYAVGSDSKKKKPVQTQRSFNEKTRMTYDAPITDPQAMQMAQAMSQYRYGSRLPGFN